MLPKLHTIGRVAGKHGFHGEMILQFNAAASAGIIHSGDFLFVSIDGKGVPFFIERFNPNNCIVKLADIDDEATVLQLTGLEIQTESPVATGEESQDPSFWLGYTVLDAGGKLVGTIVRLEEYPAGYMFIVNRDDKEFMIPVVENWMQEINEDDRYLVMDIPEGLRDL